MSGFPNPPLAPMEPVSQARPPQSGDWTFQVKWDGVRMLLFFDGRNTILQNRRLHFRTEQYPELASITDWTSHPVILDGEVIAMSGSRPSFPLVMRRDMAKGRTVAVLARSIPVHYMVFDILYYKNQLITGLPLAERQQLLEQVLVETEVFHPVENFRNGLALFEQVKMLELEGIVAKRVSAGYTPGKSRDWQKIKYRRRISLPVGGFTRRGNRINALLLGIQGLDELGYAGKVGTGLTEKEWRNLTDQLGELEQETRPFEPTPNLRGDTQWVFPAIEVDIEYAEWTPDGHLRAPVLKGWRWILERKEENPS
ncbi:MAG: DNA ligase [Solirubrobacterales bacterium]